MITWPEYNEGRLLMSNLNDAKLYGIADIVFVLDVSRSMNKKIEGIKSSISDFVDTLFYDPQTPIKDLKLGLVIHGIGQKVRGFDFVDSAEEFLTILGEAKGRGQEFGFPAIDMALDFPWREKSRKYIVFFTDETVEQDGDNGTFQKPKFMEVCQKMANSGIHILAFITRECPYYKYLDKIPGSSVYIGAYGLDDKSEPSMNSLLNGVAKTITLGGNGSLNSVARNLYGLREVRKGCILFREKVT